MAMEHQRLTHWFSVRSVRTFGCELELKMTALVEFETCFFFFFLNIIISGVVG